MSGYPHKLKKLLGFGPLFSEGAQTLKNKNAQLGPLIHSEGSCGSSTETLIRPAGPCFVLRDPDSSCQRSNSQLLLGLSIR